MSFSIDHLSRNLSYRQIFQDIYAHEPSESAHIYFEELFEDVLQRLRDDLIEASTMPSAHMQFMLEGAEDLLGCFLTFLTESCDPELSRLVPVLEDKIRSAALDLAI